MLHAVYGLWESFYFLVFEYPELDRLLQAHAITPTEVTNITARGIVLAIATLISITMAWRLHSRENQVATTIELLIATAILISTPFTTILLAEIPWGTWILSLV